MLKGRQELIEELDWVAARDRLIKIDQGLVAIIDEISPDQSWPLFLVRYPFGSKILDAKAFHLPIDRENKDSALFKRAQEQLGYSPLPLGFITRNTAEVFLDMHRKIFSLTLLKPGLELGACEHFGWTRQGTINSGARSLYMLPKISETLSHRQLKRKFGVAEPPPKHLYDHWKVFTQVADSSSFGERWYCEVLFFTEKWAQAAKSDPAWSRLELYFSKAAWRQSLYARKKAALDIAWESFVRSLSSQELRFGPYIVDTMKHVLCVCAGVTPASAPAAGDDSTGPLQGLQTIYEDPKGYNLGDYSATIMQPQLFLPNQSAPVYYSLQLPSLLESLPRSRKLTSVIDNVRELSDLFHHFLNDSNAPWITGKIGDITVNDLLEQIQIDYFHSEMFAYGDLIKSSLKMPEHDPRLSYTPSKNRKRSFASNSTFLRGCVRISPKDYQPDIEQPEEKSKTSSRRSKS